MTHNTAHNSARERVLSAIREGRVVMRPKWHFFLLSSLLGVGGIVVFLTVVYLASFILFMLAQTGALAMPSFGPAGWHALVASIPWALLIFLALFLLILEILVRRFSFAYRRPLLYSALGILVAVLIGGSVMAQTPLHKKFPRYAEIHHIPMAPRLYRAYEHPRINNMRRGTVTELRMPAGFIMQTPFENQLYVIITPRTRLPFGADFAVDDAVVVFGERTATTVQAFGIRKLAQ